MNNESAMKYLSALAAIRGLSVTPGYSLAEVATLLGTSEGAVTKMFTQGKLTPLRTHLNRFAGVLATELERYLAEINATKTVPEPASMKTQTLQPRPSVPATGPVAAVPAVMPPKLEAQEPLRSDLRPDAAGSPTAQGQPIAPRRAFGGPPSRRPQQLPEVEY